MASDARHNFEKGGPSYFKFQYKKNFCLYFQLKNFSALSFTFFKKTSQKINF